MKFTRTPAQALYAIEMTHEEAEAVVARLEDVLFEDGQLLDRFDTGEPIVSLYYELWEQVDHTEEVS